jgi:hypothetical protein
VNRTPLRFCLTLVNYWLWKMTSSTTRHFTKKDSDSHQAIGPVRNQESYLQLIVEHTVRAGAFGYWRDWPRPQVQLPTNAHCHEYDKRVFRCIHETKLHKKAFSLGALATQTLDNGMEEIFVRLFKQQEELFECHGTDTMSATGTR